MDALNTIMGGKEYTPLIMQKIIVLTRKESQATGMIMKYHPTLTKY